MECGNNNKKTTENEAVVSVEDVWVELGGRPVLKGVNLSIQKGDVIALIGPNGSGKTTLLKSMLGLTKLKQGRVLIFGEKDFKKVAKRVGYVPQRFEPESSFILSVREFLSIRLQQTGDWFFRSHQYIDNYFRNITEELGIEKRLDAPLYALSGGELQRVLIAFGLLGEPELLLLDEPTEGVDIVGEHSFYRLISEIRSHHCLTVIMVSHDISMVYSYATRVVALGNGIVCCEGTPDEVINAESLKQAYGLYMSPYHHKHH